MITAPGLHLLDHVGRDELRRRPAGDGGRRDHGVGLHDVAVDDLLGLGLLLVGELARVAALDLGVDAGVDEAAAQRLHLLARHGADVVGLHDGAEAPGGGDRLQPGHADAEHEDLGRPERPGRRRQHRVVPAGHAGRHQHGLVAGDRGLAGQRVHGLRPRDARQQLEREAGDLVVAERLDRVVRLVRLQQAEDDGALAHLVDLRRRRRVDLQDDVGGEDVGGVVDQRGRRELLVADVTQLTGAALDQHLGAQRRVLLGHGRDQGHARLTRRRLPGHANADCHRTLLVRRAHVAGPVSHFPRVEGTKNLGAQ